MMYVFYLFYLFVIAFVLTFVFSYLFKVNEPWKNMLTFFLVLFLGIWAISLWVVPFGPVWNDVHLVPPLVIGILLVLLLAIAVPSPRARAKIEKEIETKDISPSSPIIIGTFFWVFLIVLFGVILAASF